MPDVSITIAFIAGFVSFFSPCILPLIPAYITYITGTAVEEELEGKRLFTLIRTLGFVIGFTIIFMIMGISATFIGKLFIKYRNIFTKISGLLIIIFGLNMTGIIKFNFLKKGRRIGLPKKITNWFSSILVGMAFAAGWTPCIGAVLGSILVYASTTATVLKGFYLLLFYSMGMAIPFLITALLINRFGKAILKFEKILPYVMKFSGFVIVILGLLIFFNKISLIANLLL